jgi:RNA polymerase sigma-70 factor (ECF subfamily)
MEQALTMPQVQTTAERVSELDDIDGLVLRYRAQVLRLIAFSLDDPDEAASIAQDCFLRAYATRGQYRGQCAVSTWLIQIAYNLMRERVRTRKFQFWRRAQARSIDASELTGQMASGASSSESQLLARERVKQLWAVLADLSPRQRSVFVLRFVEEMELQEIVAATGMNLATVKTHLYRALHEVRSRIGNDGKGDSA